MIRYTYECLKCNRIWTEDLSIDERNNPLSMPCPYCDEEGGIKRSYTTSFLLKGGNWAKDGYSDYLGNDPDWKAGRFDPRKIEKDE